MKHNSCCVLRALLLLMAVAHSQMSYSQNSDIANVMGAFATATAAASSVGVAAIEANTARFEAQLNRSTSLGTTAINAEARRHESDNNTQLGMFDALTTLRIQSKRDDADIERNRMTTEAQNYQTAMHYQNESEKTQLEYKYKFKELEMKDKLAQSELELKRLESRALLVRDGLSTGLSRVGEALGINKIFNATPAGNLGDRLEASVGGSGGIGVKGLSIGRSLKSAPIRGKSGNEIRSLGRSFASIFKAGPASGSSPGNHKRSDLENFQRSMDQQGQRSFVRGNATPHQSRQERGLASELPRTTHTQ